MDVTCERCGTEYEFDATLVGEQGTSVKCTNCGHVFRVFAASVPASPDGLNWLIQRQDGRTNKLASLGDLQDLITRGELTRDDRISRSGEAWKPLGDIAELTVFFLAASAQSHSSAGTTAAATSPFQKAPSMPPPTSGEGESGRTVTSGRPGQRTSVGPVQNVRSSAPPG
jgi:predicted Zn finger-like uncharacterized protein